jgi:hypothetical protein
MPVGERVGSIVTRHLIHRPKSAAHFLLDPRSTEEERFALAGDMPGDHRLFNDGLGQVRDPLVFVEIAGQVGTFIGQRYFRVPLDRSCRFDRIELTLTAPAAWRVGDGPGHMSMDIHAAPAATVGTTPGGLRLCGTMEIDGRASCTGHAELRFVVPDGHRRRGVVSRLRTEAHGLGRDTPPAEPHTVGRCDPRNVVVSEPAGTDDALSARLLVDPEDPMFFASHREFPSHPDDVPAILLVEAVRQTSMLAATRTHRFSALHTSVTHASLVFRGSAALDVPLTCTARADPGGGSLDEKRTARVLSTVHQLDRVVVEADLTLTHAI